MAPDASEGGLIIARLIDADAANLAANDYVMFRCQLGGLADVVEFLNDMPTVDAVPVRYGQWECQKPCPVCGEDRFKGLDADIWADWEPPYCPNCGARMHEEITK